jgi:hypothetical protein
MESALAVPQDWVVRVLTHIKALVDCFGMFSVRVTCACGEQREIDPHALGPRVGWSITLEDLAQWLRCSKCGARPAEVVAVAEPRPRGIPKNPH